MIDIEDEPPRKPTRHADIRKLVELDLISDADEAAPAGVPTDDGPGQANERAHERRRFVRDE